MASFLIRHADGREFALEDSAAGRQFYKSEYMPKGFAIVDPPPADYVRPDLSEGKAKANDAVPRVHEKPETADKSKDAKA